MPSAKTLPIPRETNRGLEEVEMPEPTAPVEFITIKDVVRLTSLSKPVVYRMIGRHEFPRQVALSPRRVAWVRSEVERWQHQKLESYAVREAA